MGITRLMEVIREHAPSAVQIISAQDLEGRAVAIDTYITIHQFLATGNSDVTNFVERMFQRTVNIMSCGIKPVYVFDGTPSKLKKEELVKREKRRLACTDGKPLTGNFSLYVAACKQLFDLMGVPWIDAPGEGEAQCAELVRKGKCYSVSSTDTDLLALGCSNFIVGLKSAKDPVKQIHLNLVLQHLKLNHEEFVDLCILLGSDFAPSLKNIGKKTALMLIKEHRTIENVIAVLNQDQIPPGWLERVKECRKLFRCPSVKNGDDICLKWTAPKVKELTDLLAAGSISPERLKERIGVVKKWLAIKPTQQSTEGNSLIDAAAAFLFSSENVFPDNYTTVYKSEFKAAYTTFSEHNSLGKRHSFEQIVNFLKKRKYAYVSRAQITLKPLYVNVHDGKYVIFIIQPGAIKSTIFFVCQVCNRGFPTIRGLTSHQQSDSHLSLAKKFIDASTKSNSKFICNMQSCGKKFNKLDGLANHILTKEYAKVRNMYKREEKNLRVGAEEQNSSVLTCPLCSIHCTSEFNMRQHLKGRRHKLNSNRDTYRKSRNQLMKGGPDVVISFANGGGGDSNIITMKGEANVTRQVTFTVTNKSSSEPLQLESCDKLADVPGLLVDIRNGKRPTSIGSEAKYEMQMDIRPTYLGRIRIPILFTFSRDSQRFQLVKEILYQCVSNQEIFQQLQPTAPFERVKVKVLKPQEEVVLSDTKPDINKNYSLERVINLGNYPTPPAVYQAITKVREAGESRLSTLSKELNIEDLSFDNYSAFFNNLLYLEEFQMKKDIAYYGMHSVPMRKDMRTGLFRLNVPGLAENRPSVLRGDRLFATRRPDDVQRKFEGFVHNVALNEVFLGFNKRLVDSFINNMTFDIEFTINRLSIKLEHRACSTAAYPKAQLEKLLFPTADAVFKPLRNIDTCKLRFFNTQVTHNKEQSAAVKHIVCGTSRPAPYLIYGPPGTGKTFTLVEAIKQVYQEFPKSRILACAPQNAAADLLTNRLLDHIPKNDIIRINALTRPYGDIDPKVQEVSNYKSIAGIATPIKHGLSGRSKRGDMEVEYPKKDVLKQKRIIVSTLVTSGRLVSADMTKHFTHIFIDEAGHATEPETVIPLSGLIKSAHDNVQVVLAGDPKQLGPVVRSHFATVKGLGKSMLERLMSTEVYSRSKATDEFNANYVTKLVRSFRSHPDILEVPNSCFYDNELQACADKLQRERFCNWEGLPTRNFPLIFHGVDGEEEQEGKSPSWFNRYEVIQVINYVQKLFDSKSPKVKPEHVGIISPYHQQVNKITQALKALEVQTKGHTKNYARIKVGSVDKFQGDEREVIIISTVRSQDFYLTHDKDFNLGFVGNPKRFNVAITRAKALLIVIGNPAILRQDRNWLGLLTHIEEGGGYVGSPLPDDLEDTEPLDSLSERLEAMQIDEILSEETSAMLQYANPEIQRKE